MPPTQKYLFIGKTLFFPEKGILAVGDLHIGYEESLKEAGILLPEQQVKDTISGLKEAIDEIKSRGFKLKKVVFLGDIKHMFSHSWKEKSNFRSVLDFLKGHISNPEKNIILIRGNHDTMNIGLPTRDFYVDDSIAFLHGHEPYLPVFSPKVEIVVSGHLHPSVILAEKKGVKKERYKCFIEGKAHGKTFIVMPSFLDFYEGTPINHYREDFIESFSIIPKKDVMKFRIHVVSDDLKVYDFGKIRDLD